MLTRRQKKSASRIIERIARQHQVPEVEVRNELSEAMRLSRASSDPSVQEQWASFSFSGNEPTVEEFILWVASKV
jgi:hypothetical protein